MDNAQNKILLEAGTNELEIVVFRIGRDYYGINVAKVREIIRTNIPMVPIPDAHSSVLGVVNLRGNVIAVVNLAKHLHMQSDPQERRNRIIVTEFNGIHAGFWVDEVTRIYRLSWKDVESPTGLVKSKEGYAVGVIKIDGKILMLLDFEKIASIINPEAGLEGVKDEIVAGAVTFDRSKLRILIAEDSSFVAELLSSYVRRVGYQVELHKDGLSAWNALEAAAQKNTDVSQQYNLLITDIEMPQMDGLHLIKRLKENNKLKKLPCVVFSSMISQELSVKCKQVGAADQITKPEIAGLVKMVDTYVLR
ncbi:MAG: chemotaxis protein CheV [Candidatus Omnitrophica bacterium]|nr:chemotaxis protein CheV [Candidatus Omnitrophota bacterium]